MFYVFEEEKKYRWVFRELWLSWPSRNFIFCSPQHCSRCAGGQPHPKCQITTWLEGGNFEALLKLFRKNHPQTFAQFLLWIIIGLGRFLVLTYGTGPCWQLKKWKIMSLKTLFKNWCTCRNILKVVGPDKMVNVSTGHFLTKPLRIYWTRVGGVAWVWLSWKPGMCWVVGWVGWIVVHRFAIVATMYRWC